MSTARIYDHPSAALSYIGQGTTSIVALENCLSIVFTAPDKTISIALQAKDLKPMVLDLATAIDKHQALFDLIRSRR